MKHVILSTMLAVGVACGAMAVADETTNDGASTYLVAACSAAASRASGARRSSAVAVTLATFAR